MVLHLDGITKENEEEVANPDRFSCQLYLKDVGMVRAIYVTSFVFYVTWDRHQR